MKTKDSKTSRRPAWLDRLMKSMKAKDEAGVEEALKEGQEAMDEESEEERERREAADREGRTGDNAAILKTLRSLDRRMARIEARDAERERETEDNDEEGTTTIRIPRRTRSSKPSRRVASARKASTCTPATRRA